MKTRRSSSGSPRTPRGGTAGHGSGRRLRIGGGIGAASVTAVLVGLVAASSGNAVLPAAPTAELRPAPIAELRRAGAAFEAAAGKVSAPVTPPGVEKPEPVMPDFTAVARGSALGELQARFHEFQHNEWVQTGSAKVIGTEKVEVLLLDQVPTHRFSTCLDSSAVVIRDTSGAVVLAAAPPGTRTAMNIFDIQQHGGKWVVVAHSFPAAAAC